jgi:putative Ca2+/H+ antiporter (TMEM165/GDT1 family)
VEALLLSIGTNMAAEIGDKTQFLAFLLALRLRRPVPILFGVLAATAATHALAGMVGLWIGQEVGRELLRWPLGLLFMAMALWTLCPQLMDRLTVVSRGGAFLTAALSYGIAETGGKTYIMTAALGAQTGSWLAVVVGTVLGEVIVNAPLVTLGHLVARRGGELDLRWVSQSAALLLALLGLSVAVGVPLHGAE